MTSGAHSTRGLEEALEHVRELSRGNPLAGVRHGELQHFDAEPNRQRYRSASRRELDGVADHVGEELANAVRIHEQQWRRREKFGFVCLALQDAGNVNLGGFGLLETVRTRTYTDGPRNYVSHTPCGADAQDSTEWSYTWQAPATDVGTITIYMANLVANHSHSTYGDETYTQSITLTPSAVGIADVSRTNAFAVFPNPSTGSIQVNVPDGRTYSAFRVFDMEGHLVSQRSLNGARTIQLTTDLLPAGTYMIELVSPEGNVRQRFVLQP